MKREFSKSLGKVVAKFRRQAKISRKELAEMAGLEYGHIGYIERGEGCPKLETIYAISACLHVQLSEIAMDIPRHFIREEPPSLLARKKVRIFKLTTTAGE